MSNPSIAVIHCPLCASASTVHKFERGRRKGELYVKCPDHGPFMNPGQKFQDWILNHELPHLADGTAQTLPPLPPAQPAPHVQPTDGDPPPPAPAPPEPAQEPAREGARASMFPLFGG